MVYFMDHSIYLSFFYYDFIINILNAAIQCLFLFSLVHLMDSCYLTVLCRLYNNKDDVGGKRQ